MNKLNTKNTGLARIIIFPYKEGFRAVCLDFDLIEDGETRKEAENNIKEAAVGYIEAICKCNLDSHLLNRPANKRYWKLYESYLDMLGNNTKKLVSARLKKLSLYVFPMGVANI